MGCSRAPRGFTEQQPIAYSHEELAWQAAVRRAGGRIVFDPGGIGCITTTAPGSAISCGAITDGATALSRARPATGAARAAWVYRYPGLLVAGSLPIALGTTAYILGCWARARRGRAPPHAPRGARRSACLLRRPGSRGHPLDPPGRGGPAASGRAGNDGHASRARPCAPGTGRSSLQRALDSLLRQTVPPAEILVVDNAPGNGAVRALVASRFPVGALRGGAGPRPRLRPQPRVGRGAGRGGRVSRRRRGGGRGLGRCPAPRFRRRSLVSRCAPGGSSHWG